VDDEVAFLIPLKKILQNGGFIVDVAHTKKIANSFIKQNRYKVLIADLRLSGSESMDGIEVIKKAKKTRPDIKVIVITAYGDSMIKERVIKNGADLYLEKPVSAKHIREILISMLM
jgi:DNA-binding response OmpR family regulator